MATKLNNLASLIMDLFYQDYKPDDKFFDLDDFMEMVATTYNSLVNILFDRLKAEARNETGFSSVDLPHELLINETVKLTAAKNGEKVGELSKGVFSFIYDTMNTGIQSVVTPDISLIRINIEDKWKMKMAPRNNEVFYYTRQNKIYVLGNEKCTPDELDVVYLPEVKADNPDSLLSDMVVKDVRQQVMNELLIYSGKVIVDKSNDSNPNALPGTELNPNSVKQISNG